MNHPASNKTCPKCGEKNIKYMKRHSCPHVIPSTPAAPPVAIPSPGGAKKDADDIDIDPKNAGRTLADIEKELNTASTVDNKVQQSTTPTAGEKTNKTVFVNPADVVLFKDMYGVASDSLNKMFKCDDFPTKAETLEKLERMTVATLEYYKVHFSPPVALFLTVGALYGLPVLKHIGIIELIKKKIGGKGDKNPDPATPESPRTVISSIPDNKKVCACGGKNVLITTAADGQYYQCVQCSKHEKVV